MSHLIERVKSSRDLVPAQGLEVVWLYPKVNPRVPRQTVFPYFKQVHSLKLAVFHAPDASMSAVKSVSSLTISSANLGPLEILKEMTFAVVMSFRFFRSAIILLSCDLVSLMKRSCDLVTSSIESTYIEQG